MIAGSKVQSIAMDGTDQSALIEKLEYELPRMEPRPKILILNFPANPTTACVDLSFFERLVPLCKELGIYLVHDLAYADLTFDGYVAPSVMQVPGAKEIAVEFFTLSYNMPGWRVGFYGRLPSSGSGTGSHQKLLRLRDVYSNTDRIDCSIGRPTRLCGGDPRHLQGAPRMC